MALRVHGKGLRGRPQQAVWGAPEQGVDQGLQCAADSPGWTEVPVDDGGDLFQ